MKRMTFSGLDEVRETLGRENKKCCFLYLGHYCNWEYVASLQYWFPEIHCGQIYHPLYNKAFDKLFLRLRGQFGGESIPDEGDVTPAGYTQQRRKESDDRLYFRPGAWMGRDEPLDKVFEPGYCFLSRNGTHRAPAGCCRLLPESNTGKARILSCFFRTADLASCRIT